MNVQNLPPLQIRVDNKYLTGKSGFEEGILVGLRCLQNQAMQFTVLLESGALYTGLPISALSQEGFGLDLNVAQAYDNIGSSFDIITYDLIRYAHCTILDFNKKIHKGKYLFTVEFNDNNGLARHPVQWKQFHVISTEKGLMAYPQYRLKFIDDALCPNHKKDFPKYKFNDIVWLSEQ